MSQDSTDNGKEPDGTLSPLSFVSLVEPPPLPALPPGETIILFPSKELKKPQSMGPVLEITDGHGKVISFAHHYVEAVMAYPDDATARDQYLANVKANFGGKFSQFLEMRRETFGVDKTRNQAQIVEAISQHGGIETLVNASEITTLCERITKSARSGLIVGEVLLRIVQLHYFRPSAASVKKAIFLVGKRLVQGRDEHGKQEPKSPRHLQEIWARYKPVAHLWAAYYVCKNAVDEDTIDKGEPLERGKPGSFAPVLMELFLPECFSLAEVYRRIGLELRPHGRTDPILSPDETWQFPLDFPFCEIKVIIPSLEDWAVRTLEGYRA